MNWRKKFIILGALCFAFSVTLYLSSSKILNSFIQEHLIKSIRGAGLFAKIENTDCVPIKCEFKDISLFVPKWFSSFAIDSVGVSLSIPSLFTGLLHLDLSGQLYDGSIETNLHYSIRTGNTIASWRISGIELRKLPQLSAFGIKDGIAESTCSRAQIEGEVVSLDDLVLRIRNLSKPEKTSIPSLVTGLPMPIEIPPVQSLDLDVSAALKDGNWILQTVQISSSLANVQSSGKITRDSKTLKYSASIKADIKLSDEGLRYWGAFLPLISQGALQSDTKAFHMTLNGPIGGNILEGPVAVFSK